MEDFGGRLRVEALPPSARTGRFRASDERGEVAWLIAGTEFDSLHVVEFAHADARRGFHVHHRHEEQLYLFRGRLLLVARDVTTGETITRELREGNLATFAPGIAHGLVSRTPTLAICFGRGAVPFEDVEPVPDLADDLPEG